MSTRVCVTALLSLCASATMFPDASYFAIVLAVAMAFAASTKTKCADGIAPRLLASAVDTRNVIGLAVMSTLVVLLTVAGATA